MLTEQKKYLYLFYLLLNTIATFFFCFISLEISHLLPQSTQLNLFLFEVLGWILFYLIPVLLFLL